MRKIAADINYKLLRVAKSKQPWKIAPSDIHGDGVIATKDIKKDCLLGMVSEFIPIERTELGRYLNHDNNGNCKVNGGDDDKYWCSTIRDIKEGDELTVDYRTLPSPPFSRKTKFE